ncbi:hypothetical protein C8Q80DRAFT_104455 [Daedaleopsis nitida]|nr:hypothetical protein C8Q80DRAFT_104455 [Daedaleopsis nitida]
MYPPLYYIQVLYSRRGLLLTERRTSLLACSTARRARGFTTEYICHSLAIPDPAPTSTRIALLLPMADRSDWRTGLKRSSLRGRQRSSARRGRRGRGRPGTYLGSLGEDSTFVWRDIYIIAAPPRTFLMPELRTNFGLTTPFRLPWRSFRHTLRNGLCPAVGPCFRHPSLLPGTAALRRSWRSRCLIRPLDTPWAWCSKSTSVDALQAPRDGLGPHWASFQADTHVTPVNGVGAEGAPSAWCDDATPFQHVCATDHIDDWPGRERAFYYCNDCGAPEWPIAYRQRQSHDDLSMLLSPE